MAIEKKVEGEFEAAVGSAQAVKAEVANGWDMAKKNQAPRKTEQLKLDHMIVAATFVANCHRPKQLRMNTHTLNDCFYQIPGWSGRDYLGVIVIVDDMLEDCQVGMVFDVGSD